MFIGQHVGRQLPQSIIVFHITELFGFYDDLEPGDVIVIDTSDLTIEDGSGNNLRASFDGEWYKIDPNTVDTLTWNDGASSRNIDITIEKQDRSI